MAIAQSEEHPGAHLRPSGCCPSKGLPWSWWLGPAMGPLWLVGARGGGAAQGSPRASQNTGLSIPRCKHPMEH